MTTRRSFPFPATAAVVLVLLVALLPAEARAARRRGSYQKRKAECESAMPLRCVIQPTEGNTAAGEVHFRAEFARGDRRWHECLVRITANMTGLTPGKHGFHVHTYGDLSKPDGAAMGGHFTNPDDTPTRHGFPSNKVRHWGDMGNIGANADGDATYNRIDKVMTLASILGRGIILHGGADKGPKFQPSGDSGPRVGYGVIGLANPDFL